MEVSVWDTYVPREDGKVMHFDILVPSDLKDTNTIFGFGKEYLTSKSFKTGKLSSEECRFCHMQSAPPGVVEGIQLDGYFIIEMENCS
ncbi:DUF2024 family protein [Flagellimonas meridianipacifica]|uniref:Uncharacterized protein DUF2024 n=1 Tax=Flagellimonas meridianipacifica TaxID=1080225 RepID=A0A2T0MJU0_9FLAO|nr:DUF2024 family protein [Allomuricauda pacifica]PRX57842.1 uncharacterized protein DUF2024 [Allomuricauda pacifica]